MFSGKLFNSKSSKAAKVTFYFDNHHLKYDTSDGDVEVLISKIEVISSSYADTIVMLFPDGSQLHSDDKAVLKNLTSSDTFLEKIATKIENKKIGVFIGSIFAVLLLVFVFLFLIPSVSKVFIKIIPDEVAFELNSASLEALENSYFETTKISQQKQNELNNSLAKLCSSGDCPKYTLLFRNSPIIGANAFALMGGEIVVTDDLVKLGTNDEIVSVLAHEVGHIYYQHGYELFLNSLGLNVVFTLMLGDVSGLSSFVLNLPIVLIQNGYSRDMERDADKFATKLLQNGGISSKVFESILNKLNKNHGDANEIGTFFSTHPSTNERITNITK